MRDFIHATLYYAFRALQHASCRSTLTKWTRISSSRPGVIILHRFGPALTIPNLSGFVMKLETYMRMAGIPYEVDTTDPLGPKGKSPWISYNGKHYTDSQLIIEWMKGEPAFKDKVGRLEPASAEQKALGTVVRVTMDEHIFWAFSIWAFWHDKTGHVYSLMPRLRFYEYAVLSYNVRKISWGHGIGRHSPEDIQALVSESIRAVSTLLGKKKFLLGDEPCAADADVFGFFAQIVWGLGSGPASPYTRLVDKELPNVQEFCERVREKYWPDWEACLGKRL